MFVSQLQPDTITQTGQFPSNFVEECAPPSEMTPTAPSQSAPPPSFSTAPPTLSPRDVTPQADEVVDESKPKGIAMPGLGDGGDMSELVRVDLR